MSRSGAFADAGFPGPVPAGSRPAVFLDRDGTIIVERDYLSDPEGVVFVPGAIPALSALREAGFALVIVTNQSGIARGLYTEDDYEAVARRVEERLAQDGIFVDGTYHCPHHPDFTGPCDCRKPAAGMYLAAQKELGVDLRASWYVGDRLKDVLPALNLGGRGILVRTGYGADEEVGLPGGILAVEDLAAAVEHILLDPNPRRRVESSAET